MLLLVLLWCSVVWCATALWCCDILLLMVCSSCIERTPWPSLVVFLQVASRQKILVDPSDPDEDSEEEDSGGPLIRTVYPLADPAGPAGSVVPGAAQT